MIHPLSDVQSTNIGAGTSIWQFCVVLAGAKIGADCNICSHCFIENDVIIGDRVTIKCGVALWDGVRVEDGVFIGPNVTICNDKYPRSKNKHFKCEGVIIKKGASVGAAAVILPGVTIGENALIAAGSVVTRDVPANSIFIKGEVKTMTNSAHTLENGGGGGNSLLNFLTRDYFLALAHFTHKNFTHAADSLTMASAINSSKQHKVA